MAQGSWYRVESYEFLTQGKVFVERTPESLGKAGHRTILKKIVVLHLDSVDEREQNCGAFHAGIVAREVVVLNMRRILEQFVLDLRIVEVFEIVVRCERIVIIELVAAYVRICLTALRKLQARCDIKSLKIEITIVYLTTMHCCTAIVLLSADICQKSIVLNVNTSSTEI